MELLKLIQNHIQDKRKCQSYTDVGRAMRDNLVNNATSNQSKPSPISGGTDADKAILEAWNRRVGGGTVYLGKNNRYWLKNKYGVFNSDGSGYARDAFGKTTGYITNLLDKNGSFRDRKYLESFNIPQQHVTKKENHTDQILQNNKVLSNNKINSFKDAWQKARTAWENNGRTSGGIFTYKGKTYNILKEGESPDLLKYNVAYNTYQQNQNKTQSEWGHLMQKKGITSQKVANAAFKRGLDSVNEGRTTPVSFTQSIPTKILTPTSQELNSIKVEIPTNYDRSQTREWLRSRKINPYSISGAERGALRQYLSGNTTGSQYDINLVKNLNSKYNLGFKFQKGGQINMNEQQLQQAFLQYLAQQTGAKSQQELEQVIQQMGEDGLKQAYAQFVQAMQQQQVQAAKFGAKLNYIKQLNGQCPQGMEMYYYKEGGRLCKKCMQAKQNGGELENQAPANPIDAFKCGRKIRKNQQGKKFPLIETDKNGKNKKVYYKDEATRDSIAANRYNDQEVQINKPGSYKKNAKGKGQWTPDRTKAPYKKG